jgi:YVTN family beta-propeller protein
MEFQKQVNFKNIFVGIISILFVFLFIKSYSLLIERDSDFREKEIYFPNKASLINNDFDEEEIGSEKEDLSQNDDFVSVPVWNHPDQIVNHLFNVAFAPSPKGLSFSSDSSEIWVTHLLNEKRGVTVFNSETGEKTKEINLENGGGVEVIFSFDGTKAYVSQMETAKVFEIDVKTKEVLRSFNTKGTWTKVLELSKNGKFLYASNWCSNDVSEINLQTGKVERVIPTVETPRGLYLTEEFLYVAGFKNGEIQKINLKDGSSEIIFKSGGAMRHIAGDKERGLFFVSDMALGVVWQVSLENDEVKKFVETDKNPNTISLSPDKKILFVSCRGENFSPSNYFIPGPEWGSVLLFDANTGEMLDAIVAGNQPTALDISSDGKILAFSDFLDHKIEVFEIPLFNKLKEGNGGRSNTYKEDLKK